MSVWVSMCVWVSGCGCVCVCVVEGGLVCMFVGECVCVCCVCGWGYHGYSGQGPLC